MVRLATGKIPIEVLKSTVLRLTGAESKLLVTHPKAGLDFAAVKVGSGYMLVSADPITGVSAEAGKYAVIVSANDVATSGNRPQFSELVLLLPDGSTTDDVREMAEQTDSAARGLGIAIVGGHTEVTPGLRRPIVIATTFSFVREYVSSEDAKVGDSIMMTKTAGLEGTAVLAGNRRLAAEMPAAVRERATRFVRKLSIVNEAVSAKRSGFVRAMHDCTEGGVLGAVFEMSLASGAGFILRENAVPVADETRMLCEALSVDPLRLIGSGSLLLSVRKGHESQVAKALRPICMVTTIGEFTERDRILVKKGGREAVVHSAPEDELWRVLGRRSSV